MRKSTAKKPTGRKPTGRKSAGKVMAERAARGAKIQDRYLKLKSNLTERARRLFVASEAITFGYGGVVAAAHATGMAPSAIGRGKMEVRAIEDGTALSLDPTRSRRPG